MALLIPWLPDPASEQADRIDFVFWFVTAICIAIFALVAAVIVYSVLNFRARARRRRGRPADARPHGPRDRLDGGPGRARDRDLDRQRGRAGEERAAAERPPPPPPGPPSSSTVNGLCKPRSADPLKPLVVCVIAQQFAWLFKYPAYDNATSATLHLPIDTTVQLQLQSLDVIHSFWVPEFGQKQDAVPGLLTKLVITPNRLGTFPVICTELCGLGHALMRSRGDRDRAEDKFLVVGEEPARRRRDRCGGPVAASGKALFVANGCDGCHTFKPAGANGNDRARPR